MPPEALIREVHRTNVHIEMYYRYATYHKFMIDIWEDFCAYLECLEPSKARVLNVIHKNIRNYTNVIHACPYKGIIYVKADRYPFNTFLFDTLLPSGRYRIDLNFTNGFKKETFFFAQIYFSISDLRLWQ